MTLFLLVFIGDIGLFGQANTADTIPKPQFFLSLDGYLNYASTEATSLTSMTIDHNQLSLGWLSAGMSHEWGRAGVSAKLAFGPRAQQFYDEGNNSVFSNVREAFGYFDLSPNVQVRAGLFPAFYGYEADDPFDNPVYSNSWAYTLAPACPAGIEVEVALSEEWSLMLGRYNEVFSRANPNQQSVYGGFLRYMWEENSIVLSTLVGTTAEGQKIFALDFTAQYALNERTTVGTELVHQPFRNDGADWTYYYSVGLYLTHKLNDNYELALRGELLNDEGGFGFAPKTTIASGTVVVSRVFGAMKVFAEARYDGSNSLIFPDGADQTLAGLIGFGYLL